MVDALCYEDLSAFAVELDDPLAELGQDLYHRLIEEPGSNIDDPDRGFGIYGWLSRGARGADIARDMGRGIESEFQKDIRVHQASVAVTSPAVGEYRIEARVVADEGVLGIKLVANGAGVLRVE